MTLTGAVLSNGMQRFVKVDADGQAWTAVLCLPGPHDMWEVIVRTPLRWELKQFRSEDEAREWIAQWENE